jgi:hypothetical protein
MSRDDRDSSSLGVKRCPVRYIKLGSRGSWEAALDEGTLEWGGVLDPVHLASKADWKAVRNHYIAQGVHAGTATSYVREFKDFCTLGADTLWITFARDRLWWTFADSDIICREAPSAAQGRLARRTLSPWRSTDIIGRPLMQSQLSSALTKVAGYQQTMCGVEAEDYLFRVLNAQADAARAAAQASLDGLHASLVPLIQQLHWSDFELLVDLIFSRAGWQRVSRLGGTMKDHDLILEKPITREKISVQVKSRADQKMLDRYADIFAVNDCSQLYFITHNDTALKPHGDNIALWTVSDVAQQAVAAGLTAWLLEHSA